MSSTPRPSGRRPAARPRTASGRAIGAAASVVLFILVFVDRGPPRSTCFADVRSGCSDEPATADRPASPRRGAAGASVRRPDRVDRSARYVRAARRLAVLYLGPMLMLAQHGAQDAARSSPRDPVGLTRASRSGTSPRRGTRPTSRATSSTRSSTRRSPRRPVPRGRVAACRSRSRGGTSAAGTGCTCSS